MVVYSLEGSNAGDGILMQGEREAKSLNKSKVGDHEDEG